MACVPRPWQCPDLIVSACFVPDDESDWANGRDF